MPIAYIPAKVAAKLAPKSILDDLRSGVLPTHPLPGHFPALKLLYRSMTWGVMYMGHPKSAMNLLGITGTEIRARERRWIEATSKREASPARPVIVNG
jgi:hypothetical protein